MCVWSEIWLILRNKLVYVILKNCHCGMWFAWEGTHDVESSQYQLCSQDPLSFLASNLSFFSSTKSPLLQGSCGDYYDHYGTPNMLSVKLIVLGQRSSPKSLGWNARVSVWLARSAGWSALPNSSSCSVSWCSPANSSCHRPRAEASCCRIVS